MSAALILDAARVDLGPHGSETRDHAGGALAGLGRGGSQGDGSEDGEGEEGDLHGW